MPHSRPGPRERANPLTPEHIAGLSGDKVSIEGGERITGIRAEVLATGTDSVTLRTSNTERAHVPFVPDEA